MVALQVGVEWLCPALRRCGWWVMGPRVEPEGDDRGEEATCPHLGLGLAPNLILSLSKDGRHAQF